MAKKKKTTQGCDCIKQLRPKLAEMNTEFVLGLQMDFSKRPPKVLPQRMQIATRKKDSKTRRKAQVIWCNYCPCCGEKYDDQEDV